MPEPLEKAAELIDSQAHLWIVTHERPDGDALGSLLGLSLALQKRGKRVASLCQDPVPENYSFLPGADQVSATPPDWETELFVAVDCDGLKRTGNLAPRLERISHSIDLDHHASDQAFGEIAFVDSGAAATAVIVFRLLKIMAIELDPLVATCLFCGIQTDTGRFTFPNTNVEAFEVAAELMRSGAQADKIAAAVYENRTLASRRLLGAALAGLQTDATGQVGWAVLRREDFSRAGAAEVETEGIIDQIRSIKGLKAAILFSVMDSRIHVSLRSKGQAVDVSRVALRFGGGGHKEAAGCNVEAPEAEGIGAVLAAVEEELHVGK